MTRFRLTVEYDGRPFLGWQRQAHGPSVQQAIEEAIEAITHEQVTLHAAGREPRREPVPEDEAGVTRQEHYQRADEHHCRPAPCRDERRQREPDELRNGEGRDERARDPRPGPGPLADLRQDRREHPVAGGVQCRQREKGGVPQSKPPTSSTTVFRSVMSSIV
jgi:hypothetical protein